MKSSSIKIESSQQVQLLYKQIMQANSLELQINSVDSHWRNKPMKPIISKIIKRDVGDFAIILQSDSSKPVRFLYLTLLTAKNSIDNLTSTILKIKKLGQRSKQNLKKKQLKKEKTEYLGQQNLGDKSKFIPFQEMSTEMKKIVPTYESIEKNLSLILKKMANMQPDILNIFRLLEQSETVDSVLVLAFRAIASSEQLNIANALCCHIPISIQSVYEILRIYGIEKSSKIELNKFVPFLYLKQIDIQYFLEINIPVQDESQNYEELFDGDLIKYEEQIILQEMYSDL